MRTGSCLIWYKNFTFSEKVEKSKRKMKIQTKRTSNLLSEAKGSLDINTEKMALHNKLITFL